MPIVTSVFKGTTINKKMRLAHESIRHPETRILKYHGYIPNPKYHFTLIIRLILTIAGTLFAFIRYNLLLFGNTLWISCFISP